MASPYALDFNPLVNSIEAQQQLGVAKNRLAMEQERLGFERDLHPYKVEGAKLGVERERTMLPLDVTEKKQGIAARDIETERNLFRAKAGLAQSILAEPDPVKRQSYLDQIAAHPALSSGLSKYLPPGWQKNPELVARFMDATAKGYEDDLDRRLKSAQVESAESELAATRAWRGQQPDVPMRAAPGALRQPTPTQAPPAPGQRTGEPGSQTSPVYTRDENGRDLPAGTYFHTPTTVRSGQPPKIAGTQVAQAPAPAPAQAPPQQPQLPQGPPTAQEAASMPPPLREAQGNAPMMNLRDQWVEAQRMLRYGPQKLWPAAEKTLDRINKELERGVTISNNGGVVPIPGAQEAKAREKELEAAGQKRGETLGTAQANLPDAERAASYMLKKIQAVEDHPALERSTGGIGGRTWAITPEAKDFQARLAEVQGATFMQAFNALKGGGQITEKEGEKATAALNRLQEQRVGTPEYKAALADFKGEIKSLFDLAQKKAGREVAPTAPQQGDVFRMDGAWYQYLGGPLNKKESYKQL